MHFPAQNLRKQTQKNPTPPKQVKIYYFFLLATKTTCLSLCHPSWSLPPLWHSREIPCSSNPSENTAAKIIILTHQSHSSLDPSGIFCEVLSSNSLEPCPQGTPALFISHSRPHPNGSFPPLLPNSLPRLDIHHMLPLGFSFPPSLPPLPPFCSFQHRTEAQKNLLALTRWKDDPSPSHFAGKARCTEHAMPYQHDVRGQKGLQGGDGAKIFK